MSPTEVVLWVNRRLDSLEKMPETYGGLEAVEFQYLQLLEFLAICRGSPTEHVIREWRRYAVKTFGDLPYSLSRHIESLGRGHRDLVTHLGNIRKIC